MWWSAAELLQRGQHEVQRRAALGARHAASTSACGVWFPMAATYMGTFGTLPYRLILPARSGHGSVTCA